MTEDDFNDTGRFHYHADVYDTERAESGTGAAPLYQIFFERHTGATYQLYRKGRQWRMAPNNESTAMPYGAWNHLN